MIIITCRFDEPDQSYLITYVEPSLFKTMSYDSTTGSTPMLMLDSICITAKRLFFNVQIQRPHPETFLHILHPRSAQVSQCDPPDISRLRLVFPTHYVYHDQF